MTSSASPIGRPAWAANLSDRHWIIVESYFSELSGVEAALAAGLGHDRKSAREQACRLRKRQDIQDAITRLLAERVGASKARVIDEISSIAFAEPSEAISVSECFQGQRHWLAARSRHLAKLDAIASRRAAELPPPSERPITLERVGDVYSAVRRGRIRVLGNNARALAVA